MKEGDTCPICGKGNSQSHRRCAHFIAFVWAPVPLECGLWRSGRVHQLWSFDDDAALRRVIAH